MSPADLDPRMLSDMMAQQGAGQGVDYNGQPTPNVSGEPSFADMAQEIQDRYDTLIFPLQRKLDKLQKRLENNPSDQTIKNEIKRIEEQIDALEQREDMELQKLEAEVQRAGNEIEQQKQMEGYGDVEMPQESQGMPDMGSEEMEIPMMQKGGFLKRLWDKIEDKPAGGYRTFKENFESAIQDMKHAEEAGGVPGAIFKYSDLNPLIGLTKAAMNFAAEQKGLRNDGAWQGNLTRGLTVPTLGYLSGLSIPEAVASMGNAALGYYGGNAVANAYMANETGADYDRGMSGMLQDKLGIDKNYADLAVDFGLPVTFGKFGINKPEGLLGANRFLAKQKARRKIQPIETNSSNSGSTGIKTINDKQIEEFVKKIIKNVKSFPKKATDAISRTIAFPFEFGIGRPIDRMMSAFYNVETPTIKGYYKNLGDFGYYPTRTISQANSKYIRPLSLLRGAAEFTFPFALGSVLYKYLNEKSEADKLKQEEQTEKETDLARETIEGIGYQYGGITKHQDKPNVQANNDEDALTEKEKWAEEFVKRWQKANPTGIRGYFNDTPATEYITWGNALGKLFDTSGRTNIDAQNQYRYASNPYTAVYDRANREYHDQLANTERRYDIMRNELRRIQPQTEYGSMQQAFNARLAQDMLNRQQQSKIENDRQAAIDSVQNSFGKTANDAYTSMMEQSYKNDLMNEAQRKAYLQALDTYNKEKQAQFDQVVNMAAIAGNRRKDIDRMNTILFPNMIDAAIHNVDLKSLMQLLK